MGPGGHAQATTLVDGTTDSVTNLDPANEYDYGSFTLDLLIFQGLYGYPHGAKLEPVLATRCAPRLGQPGPARCSRNVKFTTGTPFTSADVKWSFDRVEDQGRPGHLRAALQPEEHVGNGTYGVDLPPRSRPNRRGPSSSPRTRATSSRRRSIRPTRPRQLRVAGRHRRRTSCQVHARPAGGLQGEPELLGRRAQERQPDHQLLLEVLDDEARPREAARSTWRSATSRPTSSRSSKKSAARRAQRQRRRDPLHRVQPEAGADEQHRVRKAIAYLMPRQTIATRVTTGRSSRSTRWCRACPVTPMRSRRRTARRRASPRRAVIAAGVTTPVRSTSGGRRPLRRCVRRRVRRDPAGAERQRAVQGDAEVGGVGAVQRPPGKRYNAFQLGWFPDYLDGEDYMFRSTSRTTSWRTATAARR